MPWTPGPLGDGRHGGSVGAGLVSASSGSQAPNASASHSKVQARGRIQAGPSPRGTETFVSDCTRVLPTGKTKEGLKGAFGEPRTDQRWGHSGRQLVPGQGAGEGSGSPPEEPRLPAHFPRGPLQCPRDALPARAASTFPQSQAALAGRPEGWGSSLPKLRG